jgi:N-methylhydantoinase A
MARAIRSVSVERGKDVRTYALVAFGGAGPFHATALARELDITTVIVPPAPGALAALGLLVASHRADASVSRPTVADRALDGELRSILHELTEQVLEDLRVESISFADARISHHVDCRYEGQSHEIRIEVQGKPSFDRITGAFHDQHAARYGFARRSTPVECVTFRATALGPHADVTIAPPSGNRDAIVTTRRISGVDVPCRARASLEVGARLEGPAVVTELDSTTWIDDGSAAVVAPNGSLVIEVG